MPQARRRQKGHIQPQGAAFMRRRQRPKWSLKSCFLFCLGLVLIVIPLTLVFFQKPLWIELEIMTTILAFFLFPFLFYVLYHGIRFDKHAKFELTWRGNLTDFMGDAVSLDSSGCAEAGAEDGPLGLLLGFILDIIVSLFLSLLLSLIFAVLLYVGVNLVMTAMFAFIIPLFFLFSRSLRYIAIKGRFCQGHLVKSLRFAGFYTVIGAIWLYVMVFIVHYFTRLQTGISPVP
jgi:hypothetical protein